MAAKGSGAERGCGVADPAFGYNQTQVLSKVITCATGKEIVEVPVCK